MSALPPIADIRQHIGACLLYANMAPLERRHPSEARQVSCRRVWISLERFLVFLDHLKRGAGRPPEERADPKILVRVHFDVVDLRIPSHGSAGRLCQKQTLAPTTSRARLLH